jgi:hypothetical protein
MASTEVLMTPPRALLIAAMALLLTLSHGIVTAQERREAERVALSDLADDPSDYVGRWIAVKGAVEDLYGRGLFSLDEDTAWSRGDQVLVINPSPAGQLRPDSEVTVVGRLQLFSEDALDDEFDEWDRDVDTKLMAGFERRPVLIAESIQLVSGGDEPSDFVRRTGSDRPNIVVIERGRTAEPGAWTRDAGSARTPVAATTDDIEDDPERYYGRTVVLRSDVDDLHTRSVFELDDDVIVIAPGLAAGVEDDKDVVVIGTVVRFGRDDIEDRARGYTLDLPADEIDEFEGRPAILATSVQIDGDEFVAAPR